MQLLGGMVHQQESRIGSHLRIYKLPNSSYGFLKNGSMITYVRPLFFVYKKIIIIQYQWQVRLGSKHANSIILKFPVKNVIHVALGRGKQKKKERRKNTSVKPNPVQILECLVSTFNCQTFEAILNLYSFVFFNIFRNSICILHYQET